MRWSNGVRVDIFRLQERYAIYDKEIMKNRALVDAYGTPATFYKNTALNPDGTYNTSETRCYCWQNSEGEQEFSQPDKRHFLCMGTGVLSGYQKYGYRELVYSTPNLTPPENISIVGSNGSAFVINNSDTSADLETDFIDISDLKGFSRFIINDSIDKDNNRVEYFYSYNDVDWLAITLEDLTDNKLGNRQGTFDILEGADQIKFRITLKKRYSNSPSPKFNSIRFRYRNKYNYNTVDPGRFPEINVPAYLTVKEQAKERIIQGEYGWKTTFPLRYWTLPEVDIENSGVLEFLHGASKDEKFIVDELIKHSYGKEQQILRTEFDTTFIRKNNDILSIADLLS